jgi:hypothetical protein
MNTANLQLEGLYMAVAALTELIKDKGLASTDEVDVVLARAEQAALAGKEALSPANAEAVSFPIRLLRLANRTSFTGQPLPFSELARQVGQAKGQKTVLSEDEIFKLASTLEHERDA